MQLADQRAAGFYSPDGVGRPGTREELRELVEAAGGALRTDPDDRPARPDESLGIPDDSPTLGDCQSPAVRDCENCGRRTLNPVDCDACLAAGVDPVEVGDRYAPGATQRMCGCRYQESVCVWACSSHGGRPVC